MKRFLFFLLTTLSAVCYGGLVFEESVVSVVADPSEDYVAVLFPFTVEGDETVVVKDFNTPCECLSVTISDDGRMVWQPGESGYVTGVLEVGSYRGTQKKYIHLGMEGGETQRLTVMIKIPDVIRIEPESLNWEVNSAMESKTMKLTVDDQYAVRIVAIKNSNSDTFDDQVETIVEGKEYLITVSPRSTAARSLGVLRFTTDSEHKRHKSYRAFLKIGKEGKVSKRGK